MEITIKCPCGSPYTVDETPVNGHLCFPVACPKCRRDGTEMANEFIRKSENGELAREKAQGGGGGGFSLSRLFSKSGDGASAADSDAPGTARMGMGVVGACVGGLIGMFAWYFIVRATGYEIGYVAWGVGVLVGLGARLAVPSGSFGLAGVAALVAATSIMGGQYLGLRHQVDERIDEAGAGLYKVMTEYAEAATKMTTDAQIQAFLTRNGFRHDDLEPGESAVICKKRQLPLFTVFFGSMMKDGTTSLVDRIDQVRASTKPTAADIADFRQREVPELQKFLKGSPSEAEFSKSLKNMIVANLSFNNMLVQSWSPYMLLWLLLGVGSAWRLAYNKSETE